MLGLWKSPFCLELYVCVLVFPCIIMQKMDLAKVKTVDASDLDLI